MSHRLSAGKCPTPYTAPANLTNQAGLVLLGPGRACPVWDLHGSRPRYMYVHTILLVVNVGFLS